MSHSDDVALNAPFISHNFRTSVSLDMFEMFCGELLGYGVARWVYVNWMDQKTVVKIEPGSASFQNTLEWEAWDYYKSTAFGKKWLAPCLHISPCGRILIQARTLAPPPKFVWPTRVPALLSDRKYKNYGMIGRRLVCHDYGMMHVRMGDLSNQKRMQAAQWWGEEHDNPNKWAEGYKKK